jgi:hypothetical protein
MFIFYLTSNAARESAATLEAESGYSMETSQVSDFRHFILQGSWNEAEAALTRLGVTHEDGLWVIIKTNFHRFLPYWLSF